MSGKVQLVGAGPGDPGLITVKGAEALKAAEVVVYDYLANPELLELAPPEAERIYVGKKGGAHTLGQEGINRLLCELGRAGKRVVRLKGGDPFVFGRGGEEASALKAAGVAFEVIPGVTSAVAAPAYAGIPVTDRRHTSEVAFVTGHEDPDKPGSSLNWAALAQLGSLVFLMGVKNLPEICAQLVAHGKPAATPAAVVQWGATPRQKTVTGDLATLPGRAAAAGITAPAVTVVGGVVKLRDQLAWFEHLPLFGRRVLVTRARRQASRLSRLLAGLGAEVREAPTIEIGPPDDPAPLARAVREVDSYPWLVFTSPNGVAAFFAALRSAGRDLRALARAQLAAIGPATAQALVEHGLAPRVVAKSFVAEGLLESLRAEDLAGKRVLLPRAAEAREVLPETLRAWGAEVDVVPAYQTRPPAGAAERLARTLDEGVDVVTFTASSTVRNLLTLLDEPRRQALAAACREGRTLVAAIGPITARAAEEAGLPVAVRPAVYTIEALVAALAARLGAR